MLRMGGADQPACPEPDYDYPRQSSQARLLLFADLALVNTARSIMPNYVNPSSLRSPAAILPPSLEEAIRVDRGAI
jgi:hypothetical protein